jgi:uncharacterized protein
MKTSHLALMFLGVMAQTFGWAIAPKRLKGLLGGLALGLNSCWFLWYLTDNRSLTTSGFWTLSPLATWVSIHMVIVPIIGVETLARLLRRWRWWVRGAGITLILGGYAWGLGEAYGPPMVTVQDLSFPDLPPAFEGYRIVLVSDMHAGPFAGPRTLNRWAQAAQALHGDLLVGGGDYVAQVAEEAERTGTAFEAVICPDGRLGVPGNHDEYSKKDKVVDHMRRHGWVMLEDEERTIERSGQRLVFLGAKYFMDKPDRGEIEWKGRPWPEGFRIGICHNPVMWPWMIQEGARLTLGAHTHGGQVNFYPFYNSAYELTPYVHGLFSQGRDKLLVTQGLGLTALPLRFRCRPEIVLITLHRS